MYIYDVYIFFYPFESVIFETVGMQMPFARSLENDTFKRVNELDFISQSQILQKKNHFSKYEVNVRVHTN